MLEPGWRLPATAGLAAGLGASPFLAVSGSAVRPLLVAGLVVALAAGRGRSTIPAAVAVLAAATLAGLFVGQIRLGAIDRSAFSLPARTAVSRVSPTITSGGAAADVAVTGFVEAEPSRSRGTIRFRLSSGRGRLMVEAPDPGRDRIPRTGETLTVHGRAGPPPDWYRPVLERHGLKVLLRADRMRSTGAGRGGLAGVIDRWRGRAERALTRSMPVREAALARGFVLGQDATIDDRTTADFRASGLSHLLAVSGQNVALLGLLAWPLLTLLGAGPRTARLLIVVLILTYMPLAGGGPSILRAGVMGIAALAATTAGRSASRIWILALAAAVTLGLDPRAGTDPGWQLSFAAVAGIALLVKPLRLRFEGLTGSGGWRRALAEGLAVTTAATLATAPLIAFHFGRIPVGAVAANLVVLPAVAPAMWLGMISGAVGQVWSGLALPFNLLNSAVLAMIAQVAAWFGRPDWAEVAIDPGPGGLVAMTAGIVAGCFLLLRVWPVPPEDPAGAGLARRRLRTLGVVGGLTLIWLLLSPFLTGVSRRELAPVPRGGARIELLDVGQGDAILLRPDGRLPMLIDGGPPGGDLRGALASARVDHLAAVLLTHPDLDHYGGLFDLFPGVRVDRFLFDVAPGRLLAAVRAAGVTPGRVGEGDRIDLGGGLRLELLWPPRDRTANGSSMDPNARSVGARLGWRKFRMYLPGDGEAEAVPVDPGPLDVLKVAHHGSTDTGLSALLARSRPRSAVIEVGDENRYGHPTAETLAELAAAGVATWRTDRDGTVSIVLDGSGYRVETGR